MEPCQRFQWHQMCSVPSLDSCTKAEVVQNSRHIFFGCSLDSVGKKVCHLYSQTTRLRNRSTYLQRKQSQSLRIFGIRFSFNLKASHQHRKYIFFNFRSFLVHWGIYLTKRNLPFCNSDLHMNNLSTVDDSRTQVIANGLRMSGWQPHGRRYHSGITAHQVKGATVKPVLGSLTCAAAHTFTYDTWAADKDNIKPANLKQFPMFDALWLSSLRSRACEFFVAFQIVYLHHFFPLLCACKAKPTSRIHPCEQIIFACRKHLPELPYRLLASIAGPFRNWAVQTIRVFIGTLCALPQTFAYVGWMQFSTGK